MEKKETSREGNNGNNTDGKLAKKIGKLSTAGCRLCRLAREARGASTKALLSETHGHIQSIGCEEMATTITAAHHSIWRHLYNSMNTARTSQSTLEFVTLDKESNMNLLWQREEFVEI